MRPLHTGICGTCDVPTIWAKDSILDGDNTSLQRMVPVRGVFYEVEEVGRFIRKMEENLGVSLDTLVFAAHKRAIKRFFEGTVKGLTGTLAKAAVPGLVYRQQQKVAPLFGVGLMKLVDYGRGGPLVVEASNVWDERLLAAEVAGGFEAVERGEVECDVDIEHSGDTIRFTARRAAREREEYRGRLVPITGTLMGTPGYPGCHVCGAPISFQVFRWDRERGEIRERDNGLRVVHLTIACIDGMLQEMVEELGEDLRDMAVRVHADYVREMVSSGAYEAVAEGASDEARRFFDYLSLIRRRCLGNPVYIDTGPRSLAVHIKNPANDVMLAGRVLGTFEAVRGVAGRLEAEHESGMLSLTVSPA